MAPMECGISDRISTMVSKHGGVWAIRTWIPEKFAGHGEALEVTTKDCRWHHYNMTAMVWRPVGPVAGHLKLVAIRCNQRQQPKTSEKDVRKSPEFCKIFDLTQETERFRWRSIWRFQPLGIQTWARKAQVSRLIDVRNLGRPINL